jgi:anti-sigma regulatory factor (Ser/Thr protein kinase)
VSATLSIPADVTRLADVRRFIRDRLLLVDADDTTIADLVQAVDETVTNVIEHGYHGVAGTIEIEIATDPEDVTVRVRDGCPPFDPTTAAAPDTDAPLARRPLGGMGIHLARVLTNGMAHRILPGGGNELTLVKRVATRGGGHRDGDPG